LYEENEQSKNLKTPGKPLLNPIYFNILCCSIYSTELRQY